MPDDGPLNEPLGKRESSNSLYIERLRLEWTELITSADGSTLERRRSYQTTRASVGVGGETLALVIGTIGGWLRYLFRSG